MRPQNRLKLGLFGFNCSSGRTPTTAGDRWMLSWPDTLRLAEMADDAGIDFLLPIGRWKGYGGETDFQGTTFETLTWAASLLAKTRHIVVFGTVHTPLFHPVIAAKQMVTADHVGEGRFALNIVCGWNEDEFEMFGVSQREHGDRYEHGQEWIDVLKRLWVEPERFDFDGKYFKLKAAVGKPGPFNATRPMIMNAGASTIGTAFALKNCDAFFTGVRVTSFDDATGLMVPAVGDARRQVDGVHREARLLGREIGVFTRAEVICRPTQAEAIEYYHHTVEERADLGAIDKQLELNGIASQVSPEDYVRRRQMYLRGFPLIGTPDTVADHFAVLASAGFDGIGLSFVNYLTEFPYFRDEVLARLERTGLRRAA
jgi:dimethylsulfone monooxygenase